MIGVPTLADAVLDRLLRRGKMAATAEELRQTGWQASHAAALLVATALTAH